ncbi:TniQ family protein [Paraburkholderia sp. SIMBA_050]
MPGKHFLAAHTDLAGRRFIWRPRPAHDEHVLSYLLRLGMMNGYSGQATLHRFTRMIKASLHNADKIAAVARLVDLDVALLQELLNRHRNVPGVHPRIHYRAISNFFREPLVAYCPACIRERGIFRAIWNIRAVTVCELHGQWLVEHCPQCMEPVGWDRPTLTSCRCGFDLGQTEMTSAPIEAALINKLILSVVLRVAEPDLLEQHILCTEACRMSALEWLATFNFLLTIARQSTPHATAKAGFETEKSATLLAARLFMVRPASAMRELNTIAQSQMDGCQPLLISLDRLIERAPSCYTNRHRSVMALPTVLTKLLENYIDDLTVQPGSPGLALNPDRLAADAEGILGLPLREVTNSCGSATAGEQDFIPLPRLIQAIRQTNVVLLGHREVEKLIGATSLQRLALIRLGLLHPLEGRPFVLSSEIDRFRRWLRDNSTLTTNLSGLMPLSELTTKGRMVFQRVMMVAIAGRMRLFRRVEGSARLDASFVTESSLTALLRA